MYCDWSIRDLEQTLLTDPSWDRWLVYADWLIDSGDERGEIIHLQRQKDIDVPMSGREMELECVYRRRWFAGEEPLNNTRLCWRSDFGEQCPVALSPDQVLQDRYSWLGFLMAHHPPLATRDYFLANLDCRSEDLARFGRLFNSFFPALEQADWLALARGGMIPNLQKLDLSGLDLDDDSIIAIADALSPGLRALDLRENCIGDLGAAALAQCPALSTLESLNLGRNQISDAGAFALARSQTLRALDELVLVSNPIGSDTLSAIAKPDLLGHISRLELCAEAAWELSCNPSERWSRRIWQWSVPQWEIDCEEEPIPPLRARSRRPTRDLRRE